MSPSPNKSKKKKQDVNSSEQLKRKKQDVSSSVQLKKKKQDVSSSVQLKKKKQDVNSSVQLKKKKQDVNSSVQLKKKKQDVNSSVQLKKNDDNPILRKKQFPQRQTKRLGAKNFHYQKKKAISNLQELHQILGASKPPDPVEKELQDSVFGCNSEDFEETIKFQPKKSSRLQKKPAWEDDDDDNILVQEVADDLTRCHKSVYLRGTEKYSEFVQEKFKKVVGSPKWADLEKSGSADSSDDESTGELLRKTGNFICPSKTLPRGIISIRKCPSLVDENLKRAILKSVEFHPASKVALIAGTNGTTDLFQIDGKINAKIQSVYFQHFPIQTAHFTVEGNEIVVGSNKFNHFYAYDMMSGKITRIPCSKGIEQTNCRKFQVSPDGKHIVIHGRYGYIHLMTAKTKEWIGSLKMNGEVIAITFNKDGSKMYSHGNTGEVYVWDMVTRTCIHKFVDEGCIVGTSLALSPNEQFLATGSNSGVVNIYDNASLFSNSTPQPLHVVMNLTTGITQMKFNCSSELLAISSSYKPNGIKLVHCQSMSVFSNFPFGEKQSPLKQISSFDISPNSGYICFGNNVGTAPIYRLKHYHNY